MTRRLTRNTALVTLSAIVAIAAAAHGQQAADTIYSGGPILTVDPDGRTVEAVAVADGRILAVGALADMMELRGAETALFDLEGRAMLPGFVDSHGHVVGGGLQALSANLLAPPDGDVRDIASLQDTLRAWVTDNQAAVDEVNMIVGFGYDESQLAELRPPTRDELDAVSADVPIIIVHQSGHFGVANTRALAVADITADTQDPPGGIIRRTADGEPNGVLEENAFFLVLGTLVGGLGQEGFEHFAAAGAALWARFGYTTGQEGRATPQTVEILRAVAARGELPIDVVAYPDVLVDREYIADTQSDIYDNRLRVGGAKLTIDGSPQGFTALRDRPYYDPVGSYPPGYAGYASATVDQVADSIDRAHANGIQIITHANGEGASDMLIAALEVAEATHGPADRRPVLIHGQFLRLDQVEAYNRLGVFPSLFPMHTFYWGDWHREQTVGPARADDISPTGWVVARGMRFGTHHDAPVAFPDSMRVLDATVTRRSRSGDILGPHQRVDVMTALRAMTIWPAWQHFEEDEKGSIEVGKLADFVVLSADPTEVDPETLDQLRVMATIKEDVVIYEAPAGIRDGRLSPGDAGYVMGQTPAAGHRFLHYMHAALPGAERAPWLPAVE